MHTSATATKGHPKGLYLLFFVEMWERFSYYGMRALLVLYMVKGLMYSTEAAGTVYGWYTGFVYMTPLIGGYIADRYYGARKCIVIGASLMALGHFAMAFNSPFFFYAALGLLIAGNGFFKPNISTTVGKLYGDKDPRRDGAFTIFYMGINLGAFFSPLVCGTLGEKYGWHYGFAAAGVGMVIGLLIYLKFQKILGDAGLEPQMKPKRGVKNEPLTRVEKQRIAVIFILAFFVIFFWASFEQAGSSLTLFADQSTDRAVLGWEFPTSWFQSVNPALIFLLATGFSVLWVFLAKRKIEPSTPVKMAMGLGLLAIGMFLMVHAGGMVDNGSDGGAVSCLEYAVDDTGTQTDECKTWSKTAVQVSLFWLLGCYLLFTLGELCLSPVGLSMVTKLSPVKFGSLLMGTWFGSNFFANLVGGLFAGQYDAMSKESFFMIPVYSAGIAAIALLALSPLLKKWMHGVH